MVPLEERVVNKSPNLIDHVVELSNDTHPGGTCNIIFDDAALVNKKIRFSFDDLQFGKPPGYMPFL